VSDGLLLDTHIALWLDSGSSRLRRDTRALVDNHWRDGGTVLLSAVSAWEIALLVDAGHITLDLPVAAWIERFLDRPGIEAAALGHGAASRAYQLHHLEHRDPADRLLIATAIELACPLVTYDDRITRFGEAHGGQYRFTVAS
jgi:PIN domain nuclease of toxin-antitoxin system